MNCKVSTKTFDPSAYTDVHTHRALAGVNCVVSFSPGVDPEPEPTSQSWLSAGVHPWHIGKTTLDSALMYIASQPLDAIGEIGLDHMADTDRGIQEAVFARQLAIAQRRGLPVVIHCVKAYQKLLKIAADYRLPAVILHSYTGSAQQTEQILNLANYYFSLGERSLASTKTHESIGIIPSERVLAETDQGELPIEEIYARLAVARGIAVEELRQTINNNFLRIFG